MTKKLENQPTSKTRIREYISDNHLTVREVEIKCQYSNGFLSAGGEIGSDKLASFIRNYPDADLYYIVTGETEHKGTSLTGMAKEFHDKVLSMSDSKEQIEMAYDIAMSTINVVGKTYEFITKKGENQYNR